MMTILPFAVVAALPALTLTCTYFEVKSPDDVYVIGRTMELGGSGGGMFSSSLATQLPFPQGEWQVAVHPRGPDGNFTNQYGYVSLDPIAGPDFRSDGMNEAGLTMSLQTMRMAEYQKADPHKTNLRIDQVLPWLLGHCASVSDVELALANISVVSGGLGMEDFIHWSVADAQGYSVVLEYVSGQRMIHTNDVRVMTNDPDYPWHLKNLNMYVGLTPHTPSANKDITIQTAVGTVPQVWSQGFNLAALPGDFSPASRFVRMFYLRQYAMLQYPLTSVDDTIVLATGLLNNVFIPRGTVATMNGQSSQEAFDFTQYALIKIPKQGRLLFRSYRDMSWRQIDLKKVDFSRKGAVPVSDGSIGIQDVTGKLHGSASVV